MRPSGTGGVCLNDLTGPHVTEDELRRAYLPDDFERLRVIKAQVDPANLFRVNHTIAPLSR